MSDVLTYSLKSDKYLETPMQKISHMSAAGGGPGVVGSPAAENSSYAIR